MIDLKNYVCQLPFTNIELHDKASFMCCPSWLLKQFYNKMNFKKSISI